MVNSVASLRRKVLGKELPPPVRRSTENNLVGPPGFSGLHGLSRAGIGDLNGNGPPRSSTDSTVKKVKVVLPSASRFRTGRGIAASVPWMIVRRSCLTRVEGQLLLKGGQGFDPRLVPQYALVTIRITTASDTRKLPPTNRISTRVVPAAEAPGGRRAPYHVAPRRLTSTALSCLPSSIHSIRTLICRRPAALWADRLSTVGSTEGCHRRCGRGDGQPACEALGELQEHAPDTRGFRQLEKPAQGPRDRPVVRRWESGSRTAGPAPFR